MLCVVYLRRRLVLVGLVLWITTLLFAYSFLAQEAEFRESPRRLQQVIRMEEPRDHLLLKEIANKMESTRLVPKKLTNPIQEQQTAPKDVRHLFMNMKSARVDGLESGMTQLTAAPPIAEYCNHDNDLSLSQEGNIASSDYTLQSVHIITRHGDRSPMYSFSRHQNPRLSCQFDPQEVKGNSALAAYIDTMKHWEGRQKGKNGFRGWALYPNRKICDSSQLTPTGAKQMVNLGHFMHERYIQRWRLLGNPFSPEEVAVQSTEYSRTYQSAVAFLYAFLPKFNLTSIPIKRSSSLFFCSEQTVSGPCTCPVLMGLKKEADRVVSSSVKNTTRYRNLMNAVADVYEMTNNRLPWMWAMMDVFLAHACNSVQLPCNKEGQCVTSGMVMQLWEHVTNYTGQLKSIQKYRQYASLALHPLLSEILENMKDASKAKTPVRLNLVSGHGATLIPLTVVLGISGDNWPRYASRLVFELYSRTNTKDYFIRVLHDGRDVTPAVVFCQDTVENELCPLSRFEKFVKEDNLGQYNDNDYINLCYSPA